MTMTDPFGIVLPGKGHYTVGTCLGHGVQGSVHVVVDRDGKETKWAVKMAKLPKTMAAPKKKKSATEIHADSIYKESLIYQNHLVESQGTMIASLPGSVDKKKIDTYGEVEGFRFLVMERMENTLWGILDPLVDDACNGTFIDCGPLAIRLIEILQQVHLHHYLLTDVKPDNIMVAPAATSSASKSKKKASTLAEHLAQRLRLVDLGLLRTFRRMGKHEDDTGTKGLQGTPLYSSLHVHGNHTPSRRDDVYGMGLVLAELVIRLYAMTQGTTGNYEQHDMPNYLPWALEGSDEAIGTAKEMQVSDIHSDFYQSMPPQAAQIVYEFLQQAHDLRFKQTPDYNVFKNLVANLQVPCMAKKKSSSTSKTAKKKQTPSKRSSAKTTLTADKKKGKPVAFTLDAAASTKPAAATKASSEKKGKPVLFTLDESTKPTAAKKASSEKKGKPVLFTLDESTKPTAAKKASSGKKPVPYVAPSKPKPPPNSASDKSPATSTDGTSQQGVRRSARLSTPPKRTRSTTHYGILNDSSDGEEEESPPKVHKAVDSDGDKVMEESGDDDSGFYSAAQKVDSEDDDDDDDMETESVEEMDVDMEDGTPASRTRSASATSSTRPTRRSGKENVDDMDASKTKKTTSKKKFMVARVVVTGGPYAGQEWTLDPGKDVNAFCIGSNPSKSRKAEAIKLPGDERLHAKHATLEIIPDKRVLKVKVTDHNTGGGTFVNKQSVPSGKERVAFRNHTIQVGGTTITIYSA